MTRTLSTRLCLESMLAVLAAAALAATLLWPEWIEALFGSAPDGGNGLLEVAVAVTSAAAAVLAALAARAEWRRTAAG